MPSWVPDTHLGADSCRTVTPSSVPTWSSSARSTKRPCSTTPGERREVGREVVRAVDFAELTVQHEVAVVGDDGAVFAFGPAEGRIAAQVSDCVGDRRTSARQHLDGDWVVEDVGLLRRVGDDEGSGQRPNRRSSRGRGRRRRPDEVPVGDLVGAVDGQVDRHFVQFGQRNARRAGQFARLEGGRDAGDLQAGVDPSADGADGVGRGAPRAEPDDLSVRDALGGGLARPLLRRPGAALFHVCLLSVRVENRYGWPPVPSRWTRSCAAPVQPALSSAYRCRNRGT